MKKTIATIIMALSLFSSISTAKEIANTELKYSVIQVVDGGRSIVGAGTIYLANSKGDNEFALAEVSSLRRTSYISSCFVRKIEQKKENAPIIKSGCDASTANSGHSLSVKVKKIDDNSFLSSFRVSLTEILALNQFKLPVHEDATPEEKAASDQKIILPEINTITTRFHAVNKSGVKYSYVIGSRTMKNELTLGERENKEQKIQYLVEITIS